MTEVNQHRSPHPGIVAVVFVVLFAASVAVNLLLTADAPYPTPYRPIGELREHFLRFAPILRWTSFLQFGAMVPLGIFSATVVSRLRFHRVDVAGVDIASFGGFAAAVFLGVSALSFWALSQPGVAIDSGAMRVAQLVGFAAGGVGHTVCLGLLAAGVCVPCLVFRLMPRWISIFGLVCAAICVLSVFSMLAPWATPLLPLGRFPAYVWLIAAGFGLPRTRGEAFTAELAHPIDERRTAPPGEPLGVR